MVGQEKENILHKNHILIRWTNESSSSINYTSPHTNFEIRFQLDWIRLQIWCQRKIMIFPLPVPSEVNKGPIKSSTDCQEWDITGCAETITSPISTPLAWDTNPTDI